MTKDRLSESEKAEIQRAILNMPEAPGILGIRKTYFSTSEKPLVEEVKSKKSKADIIMAQIDRLKNTSYNIGSSLGLIASQISLDISCKVPILPNQTENRCLLDNISEELQYIGDMLLVIDSTMEEVKNELSINK